MLFDQGLVTAGVTHGIAKDTFWANWNSSYAPRTAEWVVQVLNLYGDPCTVFVGAPEGIENHPPILQTVHVSPNPVRMNMNITVTLLETSPVKVIVFDMLGRVSLLSEEEIWGAGEQSLNLDASSLAAGIYIVRVVSGDQANTVKCVVLR
jgi:hypothetical protein